MDQEPNNQIEDDFDDLDDLGLFHKSSLKQKQDLSLPEVVQEVSGIKRQYNESSKTYVIGNYQEISQIGKGSFASVLKVKDHNNHFYAMKVYSLLKLRSQKFFAADGSFANSEEMFHNELDIIKRLDHPNIVKLKQIMYGGTYIYVVGQLCDFGQIMTWNQDKKNYTRNTKAVEYLSNKYELKSLQDITRFIFLQASQGIQYLHSRNITNRDIKVDNLLCMTTQDKTNQIKIADFTTVRYSQDDISYFASGTPGFRGPEHQNASSDGYSCKASDIWSLGISFYTFYFQFFPFMAQTEMEIQLKSEKQPLQFNQQCPQWIKTIIQKMTKKNWKERITIDQVIQSLINAN